MAADLLDRLPDTSLWIVGDKGYSKHDRRERIWQMGARPAIPHKSNEAPLLCPDYIYVNRNQVERL